MTCNEFQEVLPDVVEGVRSIDQESHLKTCPNCLDLVADLEVIFREARQLEGLHEPGPRVWNNIEATLRQEGIIHDLQRSPALLPPFRRRWISPWLMAPVAALALLAFALFYQRQAQTPNAASVKPAAAPLVQRADNRLPAADNKRLLEVVRFSTPAARQVYETNLRDVDAYIQDAEATAKQDPNDEEAQQSLINAYGQKAMVYEMAMDRSMP